MLTAVNSDLHFIMLIIPLSVKGMAELFKMSDRLRGMPGHFFEDSPRKGLQRLNVSVEELCITSSHRLSLKQSLLSLQDGFLSFLSPSFLIFQDYPSVN